MGKNGELKNSKGPNGINGIGVNGIINANGNSLLNGNNPMTGSLNGVNKLVDNDITEIKRHILHGVDTISLTSDGGRSGKEEKCTIL